MVPTAYRLTPRLAIALMLAGVTWIGWVAQSTRAQDSPKATPPEVQPDVPQPPPAPDASKLTLPDPDGAAQRDLEVPPARQAPSTPIAGEPGTAAPDPAGPEDDDPEKTARTFVERNRREAQDELKKLKDEEERLRTRLGKVEAGIRRWEALLAALDSSERPVTLNAVPRPSIVPRPEAPINLDAILRAKPAAVAREAEWATPPPSAPR
jgi:hypothetical protein